MGRFHLCAILCFCYSAIALTSASNQSVIFDCTRSINILLSNRSSPEDKDLLGRVLNESTSIYYESDATVPQMFETHFLLILDILKELNWELGSGNEFINNTLLLSFGIEKNIDYVEQRYQLVTEPEMYVIETNFKRPKINFNDTNPSVIMLYSWRRLNGCNFAEPLKTVEFFEAIETTLFNSSQLRNNSIEYNDEQIGCNLLETPESVHFNVIAISVEFVAAQKFPESYGMFKDYMDLKLENNEKYMRSHNYARTMVRIILHPIPVTGHGDKLSRIADTYVSLCSQFAKKWAEETGHLIILELSNVSYSSVRFNYKTETMVGFGSTRLDTIVPMLDANDICYYNSFNLNDINNLITSKFKTFHISAQEFWEQCQNNVDVDHLTSKKLTTGRIKQSSKLGDDDPLNLIVSWRMSMISYLNITNVLAALKGVFNQHVQAVVLDSIPSANFSVNFPMANGLDTPILQGYNNISEDVGTSYPVDDLLNVFIDPHELAENLARGLLNTSYGATMVQIDIRLPIDDNSTSSQEDIFKESFYISRVQPILLNIFHAELLLKQRNPSFRIILRLPLRLSIHVDSHPGLKQDLYCNSNILKYNQLVEAIVSWSKIHNLTTVLQGIVSPGGMKKGWFEPTIETYGQGTKKYYYGSTYLMRNYPDTMSYLDTSPCLNKYKTLPRDPIPMGNGMGCRISISVVGGDKFLLTTAELDIQLQYALHKFSSVLIICGKCPPQQRDLIISSVKTRLLFLNQSQTQIFVEVSVENVKVALLGEALSPLAKQISTNNLANILKITVSNWEHLAGIDNAVTNFENALAQCAKLKVAVGLQITKCSMILQDAEGFKTKNQQLLGLPFSHIMCVEDFQNDYGEDVEKYFQSITRFLDAQYATKLVLNQTFPRKEVYVRLDIQTSIPQDYLRGVRDVSQHAKLYNMRYFAVKGFSYELKDATKADDFTFSNIPGWWRASPSSDLTDPSNYDELESDYLGIPMWRAQAPPPKLQENFKLWMILVPVGLLTVVFGIALLAVWRISKSRYLTAAEEQEFLEGTSDGTDEDYLHMGFDRKFEISKIPLDIETDSVLGSGNFGTVYQAALNGKLVAVKVPQEGGCKESFKSTLQEIKILCHVGTHENVLGFVGAYIKEIRKGTVQIATEFCENGTLLSYLRGLNRTIGGIQGETEEAIQNVIDSYNLERFCLEISAGMEYLTGRKIIHGDLATRNVLLSRSFTCKIADFGLSRKLYEYEKYVKQSQEPLPWRWLAYESLVRMEFSSKSDVWSCGVTLWEIYSLGEVPYPGLSWTPHFADDLKSGLRCEKPRFATDELYERMMDCWNIEGKQRPSFTELGEFFGSFKTVEYTTMDGDGYLSVVEITRH